MERIPITRHDVDGTVIDGTAQVKWYQGGRTVSDFRDLNGKPLSLPPGSEFRLSVEG